MSEENEFEGYEGLTEEQKKDLRKVRKKVNPDEQRVTIELDSSMESRRKDEEINKLQRFKEFFDKNAEIVTQKAKEAGIKAETPKTVEDLNDLARAVMNSSEKRIPSGQTPLSSQYSSEGYSDDTPLREREYGSYEEMCEDLQKEAQKHGERGKEADKILSQLLAREINSIIRKGDSSEFAGSLVDLQKIPNEKLPFEDKAEVEERLKANKRKWRKPR